MRQDAKSVHNQWYYRLPGHHIKFTTYTYRLIRLRPKRRSIRCGCRINGNRSESNRRWGSHGITDSICFFQSDKTACCFWYPASAASSIFWVNLFRRWISWHSRSKELPQSPSSFSHKGSSRRADVPHALGSDSLFSVLFLLLRHIIESWSWKSWDTYAVSPKITTCGYYCYLLEQVEWIGNTHVFTVLVTKSGCHEQICDIVYRTVIGMRNQQCHQTSPLGALLWHTLLRIFWQSGKSTRTWQSACCRFQQPVWRWAVRSHSEGLSKVHFHINNVMR